MKKHPYTHINTHVHADGHGYFDTQTNAHAEIGGDAKASSHAATASITIYEKETHYSIRTCPP
jgi:hypothetical protein